MSERDDRPPRLDEDELARLLARVAERQAPAADLQQRLLRRLQGQAVAPPRLALRAPRPRLQRAVMATLACAAGAALAFGLSARRTTPALAPVSRTVSADERVILRAPAGRSAGVALAAAGQDLVHLELRDEAEVTFVPGQPARLELAQGYVRLATSVPLRLRAASQELFIDRGADVALELRDSREGGPVMRPVWLIPSSAAAGAAVTLAVLVTTGRVDLQPRAAASPLPAGEVKVLHPSPVQSPAPHRLAELEQKVSALKQENGRLAGKLAQKSGVTVEQLRERIVSLAQTPLGGLLAPGAMTDVLTDLKGLGPAGVEAMIKMLKSPKSSERFLAAKLLEDLSAPAAIDALKQMALTEKEELNANMASHAIAFMDDPAAIPALREIADKSTSWGSQVNALWALCKHGDKASIDRALAWMKDHKRPPQQRAALGGNLMLLPDPELLPIVDQTLADFGSAEQVAAFAVKYYQAIGAEGRERLTQLAADAKQPEAVRKAAREALAAAP